MDARARGDDPADAPSAETPPDVPPTRITPPISHVRALALDIGSRPAGSREEANAAAYVTNALTDSGLKPQSDMFHVPATLDSALLPALATGAFAGVIAPFLAVPATLLALLALVSYTLESHGVGFIGKFSAWRKSENVWTRIPPTGPSFRTLLVVANLDARASTPLRALAQGRAVTFANLGALAAITGLALAASANAPTVLALAPILAAVPALTAIALAVTGRRVTRTEGANQNASGTAVLLTLASAIATRPLANTTLEVLFAGSATSGQHGLHRFLDAYGRHYPKGRTLILNVESVGNGGLVAATRDGVAIRFDSDEELTSALELGASFAKARIKRAPAPPSLSATAVARARRWRAATLTTSGDTRPGDTFANVSGAQLREAAGTILGATLAIDSGAAGSSMATRRRRAPLRAWRAR